jgi:REP element-mobilizing transposase RayT
MPRQARLDAPGTLHHVIIRGIEKRRIVTDDVDRDAFVTRLGQLVADLQTPVYAWALLTNHAHLLLRSGPRGLAAFMRRLLTGYAQSYNRRHRRHGHLFQNRYKSIVCEEDTYFRELVRYIHLNPLRAKLVPTLEDLAAYPWCGHSALLRRKVYPWQDREAVLAWFGPSERTAKRAYHQYLREGVSQGQRPELVGGGLLRSQGGWAEVLAQRQRGERAFTDERVLGSGAFVETLVQEAEEQLQRQLTRRRSATLTTTLVHACEQAGVSLQEMQSGSRRRPISQLRATLAREFVEAQGLTLAEVARHLGVTTAAICKVLQRTG